VEDAKKIRHLGRLKSEDQTQAASLRRNRRGPTQFSAVRAGASSATTAPLKAKEKHHPPAWQLEQGANRAPPA